MKKIISVILLVSIVLSLCFCVSAKTSDVITLQSETITFKNYLDNSGSETGESNQPSYKIFNESTVNRLKALLLSAAENAETNISLNNISAPITVIKLKNNNGYYDYSENKYKINSNKEGAYDIVIDENDIKNVFRELCYGNEFFFNFKNFAYSYSLPYEISANFENETTTIPNLIVNYKMSKEEYDVAKSFCIKEMDRIIRKMDDSFSYVDKLLFIHDYFVQNFSYQLKDTKTNDTNTNDTNTDDTNTDDTNTDDTNTKDTNADMYRFFKYGCGVCQAYTLAYKGILNRLGIENTVAISDVGNHIWNVAKLEDGSYYHIDCTQDDPLYEYDNSEYALPGFVSHNLFLLSDEKMLEQGGSHINWYTIPYYQSTVTCNNTRFDDAEWRNTIGAFSLVGDKWYAITPTLPTDVYSFSKGTLENKTLVNTYRGMWSGYNPQRCVVNIGNLIYFSDPYEVVCYDVLTDKFTTVINTGNERLYGCFYAGQGQLGYYFVDYFQQSMPTSTFDLNVGDINRDGSISAEDLTCMVSIILEKENMAYNRFFADLNFDEGVSIIDLVKLKRVLANQN